MSQVSFQYYPDLNLHDCKTFRPKCSLKEWFLYEFVKPFIYVQSFHSFYYENHKKITDFQNFEFFS